MIQKTVSVTWNIFVLEFTVSSNGGVVFRMFKCIIAGILNAFKRVLNWPPQWSVLSRALTGSTKKCSTFTNQFISLKALHSV